MSEIKDLTEDGIARRNNDLSGWDYRYNILIYAREKDMDDADVLEGLGFEEEAEEVRSGDASFSDYAQKCAFPVTFDQLKGFWDYLENSDSYTRGLESI